MFWREAQAKTFFGAIAGLIMRDRRWWFQHPRWHVWHWQIKVEPLLQIKRWLFSRCAGCRKGFAYGYTFQRFMEWRRPALVPIRAAHLSLGMLFAFGPP